MMDPRAGKRVRQRGFVLLLSLGVVVFFSLAIVAILVRSVWQSTASTRIYNRSSALNLADAAVDQAALNLVTAGTADDLLTATLAGGTFQIESVQAVTGTLSRVTVRGTSGTEVRRVEAIIRLTPKSIFQFALFGDQNVTVSGSAITDSYNSTAGPYSSGSHNGDIGTNATTAGGVVVSGSIFVDGQVAVGSTASNPQSVVTGYNPAFITGGTSPPSDTQDIVLQGSTFPLTPLTVPAGMTCNDYTIQGSTTTTLSPTGGPNGDGVYCYRNLTVQGSGVLTASGPVTVYVTGQLIARGSSRVGVVSSPKQMVVLMTSTAEATLEQGTLTGSTDFYGALYAPNSTITITGSADIYGSIIAKAVNLTGSAEIHYDEALNQVPQAANTFTTTRVAWREL